TFAPGLKCPRLPPRTILHCRPKWARGTAPHVTSFGSSDPRGYQARKTAAASPMHAASDCLLVGVPGLWLPFPPHFLGALGVTVGFRIQKRKRHANLYTVYCPSRTETRRLVNCSHSVHFSSSTASACFNSSEEFSHIFSSWLINRFRRAFFSTGPSSLTRMRRFRASSMRFT